MNQRTLIGRLLSPAGFGLVVLFFLMPFVTISCGTDPDRIDSTFTGIALATGGEPKVAESTPPSLVAAFAGSYHAEVLMVLAAIALLGGMAAGLVRDRLIRHGAALALAVVACALLVAEIRQVPSRVEAALQSLANDANAGQTLDWAARPGYGFWLSAGVLVLLTAGHASALARVYQDRKARPSPPGHLEPDEPPGTDELRWAGDPRA